MTAIKKTINNFKTKSKSHYLIALVLATLMLGYAPSSIGLSIFVLYSITSLFFVQRQKKLKCTNLLLPILVFIWFTITYFWSIDKELTLKGIGRMTSLIIIPSSFMLLPMFSQKQFKTILDIFTWANILLGGYFVITSIIRFFSSGLINELTYHDFVSNLELNAIYVSAFFAISFFYLLDKSKKKNHEIAFIAFLFLLLILLSSKAILFCVFLGVLIFGFKTYRKKGINSTQTILLILIGVVIVLFSSHEISNRINEEIKFSTKEKTSLNQVFKREKFSKVYPWTGTSIRLFQLRLLKEQIEQEGIFLNGFGLFASRIDLKKKHLEYNTYKGYHGYNYHNNYAQILSETGVFGLLLFIVLLISNFLTAIKSKSHVFIFFSILIPIWCLSESILWVQRGIMFFTIFYCLFSRVDYNTKIPEV